MPIFGTVEGAFVTSKAGPVRVIRSYVGANSGPNTQRTHIFYDRREDIITDLRVHSIPSILDFMDYSPAATGMTYRNELNPGGVTVDGNPDTLTAGASSWEQITGSQGTINQTAVLQTSWTPGSITSYNLDDSTPTDTQCTGDAFAIRIERPLHQQHPAEHRPRHRRHRHTAGPPGDVLREPGRDRSRCRGAPEPGGVPADDQCGGGPVNRVKHHLVTPRR